MGARGRFRKKGRRRGWARNAAATSSSSSGEDELARFPSFGAPRRARWTGSDAFRPVVRQLERVSLKGERLFRFPRQKTAGLRPPLSSGRDRCRRLDRGEHAIPRLPTTTRRSASRLSVSESPGVAYDAVYLLAYAGVFAGRRSGPLRAGPVALRAALDRRGSGAAGGKAESTPSVPSHVVEAIEELAARGRAIDLETARLTRMDLDPSTLARRPTTTAVQCVSAVGRPPGRPWRAARSKSGARAFPPAHRNLNGNAALSRRRPVREGRSGDRFRSRIISPRSLRHATARLHATKTPLREPPAARHRSASAASSSGPRSRPYAPSALRPASPWGGPKDFSRAYRGRRA